MDQGEPARSPGPGGISNVSSSFRGSNAVRETIHALLLCHATGAGLDMGIVNAGALTVDDEIDERLGERIEVVVLNRRPDATERRPEIAAEFTGDGRTADGTDELGGATAVASAGGITERIEAFTADPDDDIAILLESLDVERNTGIC